MKTECICGHPDVPVVTETVERVWGSPNLPLGEHRFNVKQTFHRCPNCGEEFFTAGQMDESDKVLNELLKEKLGFDWLERNRQRRESRNKSNNSN